jgi:hypothetical protein
MENKRGRRMEESIKKWQNSSQGESEKQRKTKTSLLKKEINMQKKLLFVAVFLCTACLLSVNAEETETGTNLLPWDFQLTGKNGLPEGYNNRKEGTISVTKEKNGYVVEMSLKKQGQCFLDTTRLLPLEKGKKYLFSVQVKIKNMEHAGKDKFYGFVSYIYNSSTNKHTALRLTGTGSINEWATLSLPFDTIKQPQLAKGKLLMRAYNISGSIYLKKPVIIELPENVDMKPSLTLKDGKTFTGYLIRLPK